MKKIYKYTLEEDGMLIEIPSNTILSAISQNDNIVVYALIDFDNLNPYKYMFRIIGTGNPILFNIENFKFLNTVTVCEDLMFHIFYKEIINDLNNEVFDVL